MKALESAGNGSAKAADNVSTKLKETVRNSDNTNKSVYRTGMAFRALKESLENAFKPLKGLITWFKYLGIEFAAMIATMGGMKLALVTGQYAMKLYRISLIGLGAAAGTAIAGLSGVMAAMRELQVAQARPMYKSVYGNEKGAFSPEALISSVMGDKRLGMFDAKSLQASMAAYLKQGLKAPTANQLAMFGDYTGGDSKSLTAIANAMATAQKAGKLTNETYKEFQKSAPGLAKAFEELAGGPKAAESATIAFDKFNTALQEGKLKALEPYKGALDEINNTLMGKFKGGIATLKEKLTQLGSTSYGELYGPNAPYGETNGEGMNKSILQAMKEPIDGLTAALSNMLNAIGPTLQRLVPQWGAGLEKPVDGMIERLSQLIVTGMEKVDGMSNRINMWIGNIRNFFSQVSAFITPFANAWDNLWTNLLKPTVTGLVDLGKYFLNSWHDSLGSTQNQMSMWGTNLQHILSSLKGFIDGFSAFKVVMAPLITSVLQLVELFTGFFDNKLTKTVLAFATGFILFDRIISKVIKTVQKLVAGINSWATGQDKVTKSVDRTSQAVEHENNIITDPTKDPDLAGNRMGDLGRRLGSRIADKADTWFQGSERGQRIGDFAQRAGARFDSNKFLTGLRAKFGGEHGETLGLLKNKGKEALMFGALAASSMITDGAPKWLTGGANGATTAASTMMLAPGMVDPRVGAVGVGAGFLGGAISGSATKFDPFRMGLGSALSMGSMGGMIGNSIAPGPWGVGIGAAIGAGIGLYQGFNNAQDAHDAFKRQSGEDATAEVLGNKRGYGPQTLKELRAAQRRAGKRYAAAKLMRSLVRGSNFGENVSQGFFDLGRNVDALFGGDQGFGLTANAGKIPETQRKIQSAQARGDKERVKTLKEQLVVLEKQREIAKSVIGDKSPTGVMDDMIKQRKAFAGQRANLKANKGIGDLFGLDPNELADYAKRHNIDLSKTKLGVEKILDIFKYSGKLVDGLVSSADLVVASQRSVDLLMGESNAKAKASSAGIESVNAIDQFMSEGKSGMSADQGVVSVNKVLGAIVNDNAAQMAAGKYSSYDDYVNKTKLELLGLVQESQGAGVQQPLINELVAQIQPIITKLDESVNTVSGRMSADPGFAAKVNEIVAAKAREFQALPVDQQTGKAGQDELLGLAQQSATALSQMFPGMKPLTGEQITELQNLISGTANTGAQAMSNALVMGGRGVAHDISEAFKNAKTSFRIQVNGVAHGDILVGDTSTARYGQTLAQHAALTQRVPGNRRITSGLRDYALGSPSSDHLMGRAYDLTGDNLGAYGALVRAQGGFAEMHGSALNRHLHVVPGPAGDTSRPIGVIGSGAGMVMQSHQYSIVVNAADGASASAVADEVMARIDRRQREAMERR